MFLKRPPDLRLAISFLRVSMMSEPEITHQDEKKVLKGSLQLTILFTWPYVLHKIFNLPDLRLAISFLRVSMVSEPGITNRMKTNVCERIICD